MRRSWDADSRRKNRDNVSKAQLSGSGAPGSPRRSTVLSRAGGRKSNVRKSLFGARGQDADEEQLLTPKCLNSSSLFLTKFSKTFWRKCLKTCTNVSRTKSVELVELVSFFLNESSFLFSFLSHYFLSIIFNAPTDTSRSRKMLEGAYLDAKIGVDTRTSPPNFFTSIFIQF